MNKSNFDKLQANNVRTVKPELKKEKKLKKIPTESFHKSQTTKGDPTKSKTQKKDIFSSSTSINSGGISSSTTSVDSSIGGSTISSSDYSSSTIGGAGSSMSSTNYSSSLGGSSSSTNISSTSTTTPAVSNTSSTQVSSSTSSGPGSISDSTSIVINTGDSVYKSTSKMDIKRMPKPSPKPVPELKKLTLQ